MTSPSTTYTTPRVGIGTFVTRPSDHRFLIGLRTTPHGNGTWGLVGGHLEPGETLKECSLRESAEEIGDTPLRYAGELYVTNDLFPETGKHYITIFTLAVLINENHPIINNEPHKCAEWRWVTEQEMLQLPEPLMEGLVNLATRSPLIPQNLNHTYTLTPTPEPETP